jgi:phosphate transport system substrate-binding protein
MKKRTIIGIAAIAAAVMVSCSGGGSSDGKDELTGSVRIDGSSTVYPITEAVAEEFRKSEPGVRVTIGVSGTGGGFQKFARAETDISNASRAIKDKEIEAAEENGVSYLQLAIAYDGLAVVVHPENSWAETITVEELKTIWEPEAQGTITRWNQIRESWPDEAIRLYGPGVASGTFDYFTEVIVGKSGKSRGDFTASEDDHVLVQGVATDKYALGFFGLAYFTENADKLKLVGVDNGNGPVVPSEATVNDGTYSPLSRPMFIYVNNSAGTRKEVQEFVKFYLKNCSSLASDVGYIALPDSLTNLQIEKFSSFIAKLN